MLLINHARLGLSKTSLWHWALETSWQAVAVAWEVEDRIPASEESGDDIVS